VRKTIAFGVMLLLSAVWLRAQDAGKTSNLETIEGCLQMTEGQYNLIDDTGTIHHLVGGGSKLKQQVGHEVEIAGKTGARTLDATPPGGASNAVTQVIFEVKSVKHIADVCK
jgi:hypothetical protein